MHRNNIVGDGRKRKPAFNGEVTGADTGNFGPGPVEETAYFLDVRFGSAVGND